jgi:hypothetical protein
MTPATSTHPITAFDVHRVRRDFPILGQTIHGKPLVYLDNAATTQKPQAVIDAMVRSYARTTRTFIAACTCSASGPPRPTSWRAKRCSIS